MKSARKALALIMCMMLLSLGLMACSNTGSNEPSPPATTENKTDTSGEKKEVVSLKLLRFEHPSQAVKKDTPVLKEILKRKGIDLQVEGIPQSNYEDKKQVLIGTNNIPDIILVQQKDINAFAHTGMFLNLSDYLDKMPNFQKELETYSDINMLKVDGNLYGFPLTDTYPLTAGKAPIIRMDILKELDLDVPTTYDELYMVLKKMKEAYPDSAPFTSRGGGFLDAIAFGMNSGLGIYLDPDIEGGKYVYGNNKPAFKEVLTYLNKLYSEKLLDQDYAVNTTQNWTEKMSSGKSFFYFDNNSFAVNFNQSLRENNPNAALEVIPYMKNSTGKSRGFIYPVGWIDWSYAISSKVKDPEAVIALYDWLYSPEGSEVSNFGALGETYEMVDGQPKLLDSIIGKYEKAADPVRTMQSELGIGYLALSPKVDSRPVIQVSDPDLVKWGKLLDEDPGYYRTPAILPALTDEEQEKVKQINSRISPINGDITKFIMGSRSLTEFDQYAEALTAAGVEELEEIYNAAYARVSGN